MVPYLVMGFGVCDACLRVAAVGQRVHDVAHLPLVVCLLLQQLNPLVRNRHLQPVVEPDASLCNWPAQEESTALSEIHSTPGARTLVAHVCRPCC